MKSLLIFCLACSLCLAESVEQALSRAESLITAEKFAEAEQVLVSAAPENVEVLYRLGYVRYRQRKLAPARISFSKAVKLSPPAYYSRYFLGQISLLENKPAEAISWLRPVVESGEPIFDAVSRLAAAYAQTGEITKAEAALRTAIGQTPWEGSLYFRLGQLQQKRGSAELARESFAQSNRLKQATRQDVETLMTIAKNLRDKNYVEAFRRGEAISGRQDVDPGTLVALGVLYGGADRHQEALQVFNAAAERDPRFYAAQLNRGLALLRTGEPDAAAGALRIASDLLPQSSEATLALGLSMVMQGRYSDAVGPLEQAWRQDATNARAGALLATAYLRTNAAAKAVAVLKQPAFAESIDPAYTLLMVDAQTAAQDLKGALETTRVGSKRFAKVPEMHLAQAQVLVRMGQYGEAQSSFQRALELRPTWAQAHVGLGDCLQKSGQHEAALEHYRAAASERETALAARLGLGRSLIALRKLEDARATLEEAAAAYPQEVAVRVELSRVYARLGKNDLAADQTRAADQLRAAQAR